MHETLVHHTRDGKYNSELAKTQSRKEATLERGRSEALSNDDGGCMDMITKHRGQAVDFLKADEACEKIRWRFIQKLLTRD